MRHKVVSCGDGLSDGIAHYLFISDQANRLVIDRIRQDDRLGRADVAVKPLVDAHAAARLEVEVESHACRALLFGR